LEQSLTEFVPVDDPVKICMVRLKNTTDAVKNLSVTYYIRPVLGVNENTTAQYITTGIHKESGMMLLTNTFNPDFPDRIAFMDVSEQVRSITGDRTEFIGLRGSLRNPEALRRTELSGKVGAGLDPCGAVQAKASLEPGQERTIVFLLGQAASMEEALQVASKYKNPETAEDALNKVKSYWLNKLGAIQVKTPDDSINIMLNGWLQYQVVACRLWARSAFYQSGGAYGYRDQLQDVMAVVYTWPELTRKQILLHASHQFLEGDVQHWWHPGADKGIRTRYSDDYLWLPYVTIDYIRNTGDWNILDEVAGYLEDEPLAEDEDERYNIPRISAQKSNIYEHCIRAIENGLKFGPHGIPLIGCGDWNDGMNTVGNKGKGESVWLGWFLYTILNNFIPICIRRGDKERAERYRK
jgi:cellobiose phosphorylase